MYGIIAVKIYLLTYLKTSKTYMYLRKGMVIGLILVVLSFECIGTAIAETIKTEHNNLKDYPALFDATATMSRQLALNIFLKLNPDIVLVTFSSYAVLNYANADEWNGGIKSDEEIKIRRESLTRIEKDINAINFNTEYQSIASVDLNAINNSNATISSHSLNRISFDYYPKDVHPNVYYDNAGSRIVVINKADIHIDTLPQHLIDLISEHNPLLNNAVVHYRIVGTEGLNLRAVVTRIDFYDENNPKNQTPIGTLLVETNKYHIPTVSPLSLHLDKITDENILLASRVYANKGIIITVKAFENDRHLIDGYCRILNPLDKTCDIDRFEYQNPNRIKGSVILYQQANGSIKITAKINVFRRHSDTKVTSFEKTFYITPDKEELTFNLDDGYKIKISSIRD